MSVRRGEGYMYTMLAALDDKDKYLIFLEILKELLPARYKLHAKHK